MIYNVKNKCLMVVIAVSMFVATEQSLQANPLKAINNGIMYGLKTTAAAIDTSVNFVSGQIIEYPGIALVAGCVATYYGIRGIARTLKRWEAEELVMINTMTPEEREIYFQRQKIAAMWSVAFSNFSRR